MVPFASWPAKVAAPPIRPPCPDARYHPRQDRRRPRFDPPVIEAPAAQRRRGRASGGTVATRRADVKPVAVIQYAGNDGPGRFGDYMAARRLPLRVFHAWNGEALPGTLDGFGGLCLLGGPMSVNDDLPFLRESETLIRAAIRDDVPVLGHCLGGQLMSAALGGKVTRAAQPEIGWIDISTQPHGNAAEWFGSNALSVFQWHADTFSVPAGARHLATSAACENQAFACGELHLAMQFHCEITIDKIDDWIGSEAGRAEIAACTVDSVQSPARIRALTAERIAASLHTADHIYWRWTRNLRP